MNTICLSCNGSGYYDSDDNPPCGACDGTGEVDDENCDTDTGTPTLDKHP